MILGCIFMVLLDIALVVTPLIIVVGGIASFLKDRAAKKQPPDSPADSPE